MVSLNSNSPRLVTIPVHPGFILFIYFILLLPNRNRNTKKDTGTSTPTHGRTRDPCPGDPCHLSPCPRVPQEVSRRARRAARCTAGATGGAGHGPGHQGGHLGDSDSGCYCFASTTELGWLMGTPDYACVLSIKQYIYIHYIHNYPFPCGAGVSFDRLVVVAVVVVVDCC